MEAISLPYIPFIFLIYIRKIYKIFDNIIQDFKQIEEYELNIYYECNVILFIMQVTSFEKNYKMQYRLNKGGIILYSNYNSGISPQFKPVFEKIKTLKVIGQEVGQLVVENSTCINAIKIDRVKAFLLESHDHLFCNKVVKQGTIRKEVFYVNPENRVRFLTEDIPFMLTFDIPGFKPNPFSEIQTHLLDIDVDYILSPSKKCIPGCLKQIVVAHILVVVSEWTQLDVLTKIDIFPKTNVSSSCCRVICC